MKNSKFKIPVKGRSRQNYLIISLLFIVVVFFIFSCGYKIVGSNFLPFDSITIKLVKNKTYEPRLEERLHNALSSEFISQGIKIAHSGGDAELEATITRFAVGAVGSIDEDVKEQNLIMLVDVKIVTNGEIVEFKSIQSAIYISFDSSGSISDSVANKERATDKASREIAKEIVSKLIIRYVK